MSLRASSYCHMSSMSAELPLLSPIAFAISAVVASDRLARSLASSALRAASSSNVVRSNVAAALACAPAP